MEYIKSFLKHKLTKGRHEPLELKDRYDIVLHVGAPKSGTSALQHFFLKNHSVLQNKEVYYPKHDIDPNGISGGHSKLAIDLMQERPEEAKILFNTWYESAKRKNRLLLLSSEAFFNLAQKMKPFLKDKRVLVIAYHRDIVEYYISVHNQLIKRHYGTVTFSQYAQSVLRSQNSAANLVNKSFLATYQEWEEVVGRENLTVRPYGRDHFSGGRIEKDFIEHLGMGLDGFVLNNKKINPSYTDDALELKRMINHVIERESPLNDTIDVSLQKYSEIYSGMPSGKHKSSQYQELYRQLRAFFEKEEKRISETYLQGADVSSAIKMEQTEDGHTIENKAISLQKAFDYLEKDEKIKEYLFQCTVKKLELGYSGYALFTLAGFLKIPHIEEYAAVDHWFRQGQLDRISSGTYKEADILRDIAILLERRGDIRNAYRVIDRAHRLRPEGKAIAALRESLKALSDTL